MEPGIIWGYVPCGKDTGPVVNPSFECLTTNAGKAKYWRTHEHLHVRMVLLGDLLP